MKKKSLKNIIHNILALCLVCLLASCSTDDNTDAVAINNVAVNKSNAYIEDKIILNIDGTGYTDANVYSLNANAPVKFAKTAPTTFEITSTATVPRAIIFAQLKNATNKAETSLEVNFFIHGVDNFSYAEGIRPTDSSAKVLELLGVPTNITATTLTSTTTETDNSTTPPTVTTTTFTVEGEIWAYPTKGISVVIEKSKGVVRKVNLNSSNFFTIMPDGTKVNYTNYAGNLGNSWKINNTNTKMEAIIAKFGAPTVKASDPNDPTLRTYTFSNNTRFSFYGATENDYVGKLVQSFSL